MTSELVKICIERGRKYLKSSYVWVRLNYTKKRPIGVVELWRLRRNIQAVEVRKFQIY